MKRLLVAGFALLLVVVAAGCMPLLMLAGTQATTATPLTRGPVGSGAFAQAVWNAAANSELYGGCRIDTPTLHGVAEIETRSLAGVDITPGGDVERVAGKTIGPALDGNGFAAIPDSDGGLWDGDPTWDRAVGPAQFIPTSWSLFGRDANGDGVKNPFNVWDSMAAMVAHLCSSGYVEGNLVAMRQAIFGYNQSWEYVADVLAARDAFLAATMEPLPGAADPSTFENGRLPDFALEDLGQNCRLAHGPAAIVRRMVADAEAQGVRLGLTSCYRSYEEQEAIGARLGWYDSGGLAARPGKSVHGWGRALDLGQGLWWVRERAVQYGLTFPLEDEPWHAEFIE